HVLLVTLKQRTMGNCSLQVQLVKTQKELPRTIEITGAHPLGTAKLTGYVVVSSEVGVQARTASFEGLTEVPVNTVQSSAGVPPAYPGGAGETPALHSGAGLAYKFLSSGPVP